MARGPGFFAGFLVGAVIGAGAALLLAPRPGVQMRERLLESLPARDEWRARVEEASAAARTTVDALVEAGRDLLDQQRLRFQEAVREGREAAEETKAELLARYDKARRGEGDPA